MDKSRKLSQRGSVSCAPLEIDSGSVVAEGEWFVVVVVRWSSWSWSWSVSWSWCGSWCWRWCVVTCQCGGGGGGGEVLETSDGGIVGV